jgi:2,3-bisphosphoglycerate-independent phosphoglycerate mutase
MLKQSVLIVLDGAADLSRVDGRTPLETAETPSLDRIATNGFCGLMKTLYSDLHRGSIVAQLGMLGFEPHRYYPHGRASCEARGLGVTLGPGDLAFRANLVKQRAGRLTRYNADYIKTPDARPLIERLHRELSARFPGFELYHNSDFRNTLIVRNADVVPTDLCCSEPHEEMNTVFDFGALVTPKVTGAECAARRINAYCQAAKELLDGCRADAIFPWSCSSAIELPPFPLLREGPCAFIGHMDFLNGIAAASGVDFYKIGTGDWDTDYAAKGATTVELLRKGYRFVFCHINAPDEASHMGDFGMKVYSIEQIDRHIARPVVDYFTIHPERLGAVVIAPDHYTNTHPERRQPRIDVHSVDPVPFAVWNGLDRDSVIEFTEDAVQAGGRYARTPINHLELLPMMAGAPVAES